MKFRIKRILKIGYWPQVKTFWGWKRIARHPTGFGLYSENSIDYPLENPSECLSVVGEYKEWLALANQKPTYGDVV